MDEHIVCQLCGDAPLFPLVKWGFIFICYTCQDKVDTYNEASKRGII
jgi:hypothetical protein